MQQLVLRAIIFLVMLFLITKLVGKKQLAELSFFEYVSGITIGSIAGEVIMGLERNIWHGINAILIFGIATYLVDAISIKSKKFRDLVEGKAAVLIEDGKILEDNLKKEKYTIDELNALLRQKNVFKAADVEFAVLEANGDLSVLLKKEHRPLTPKDLNMNLPREREAITVIMDGIILKNALEKTGKTRSWLEKELRSKGTEVDKVFFAQVDSSDTITFDLFNDHFPAPRKKKMNN
ncbi:DUF421 domain-containing protein [Mesobacillus foraminis]|uniref:DUF421 domain-containing protein n=1 Tax=Mesobacillus foraminis TaxID=279826 RepID=UPI001BE64260|nr:DUF421 domain-containing protein [Mesobacillus foraminis]MBT2755467.1 DUF421 domain-containing protein [Mesobacillus foraminis]